MNLVSVEQFRQIMQLHPFHSWTLADAVLTPVGANCNDLIHEHAWQGVDMAGLAALLIHGSVLDWLGMAGGVLVIHRIARQA